MSHQAAENALPSSVIIAEYIRRTEDDRHLVSADTISHSLSSFTKLLSASDRLKCPPSIASRHNFTITFVYKSTISGVELSACTAILFLLSSTFTFLSEHQNRESDIFACSLSDFFRIKTKD